jgi:hypothetical protein
VNPAVDKHAKIEFAISSRMGTGSWVTLIVLLSLLAASVATAAYGWALGDDVALPASDYVAMALGIVFSLVVGIGLMALIFFSSRNGYDESPKLIAPRSDVSREPEQPPAAKR